MLSEKWDLKISPLLFGVVTFSCALQSIDSAHYPSQKAISLSPRTYFKSQSCMISDWVTCNS